MDNQYQGLRLLLTRHLGKDAKGDLSAEDFFDEEKEFADQQRAFLEQMNNKALARLQFLNEKEQETAEDGTPIPPPAMDYLLEAGVAKDGMAAWFFLFPPENGGSLPDQNAIVNGLAEKGIVYGLDAERIEEILSKGKFLHLSLAARGVPAKDGEDGQIIDHMPREKAKHIFAQDEKAKADYKNLQQYQKIHAGDLICEIIPPTKPQDGMTVTGAVLKGKPGKKLNAPKGKNTRLSEDGSQLLADVDGQISFHNGLFQVDQITTIGGNVDTSTGNIDVIGDLIVNGDVLNGFAVKATGDIVVRGAVENAVVVAGGSIRIQHGMNGNGSGTLDAKGVVSSSFLENCNVIAGKSVQSGYLINCNISSNGSIEVTTGKGVIIGGNISALHSIEAKTIGSLSHAHTALTLGATAAFLQEKADLEEEVLAIKKEADEMEKNIAFIESYGSLPPQYQELYRTTKVQLAALKAKYSMKKKRLSRMEEEQADLSQCFIKCNIIYPTTYIQIGGRRQIIDKPVNACHIYYSENDIVIGLK